MNPCAPNAISHLLKISSQILSEISDTPILDAKLFMMDVLDFSASELIIKNDYILDDKELNKFKVFVDRRLKFEPVAYILGHKGFMDLDFNVSEGVLIPRPETEHLVFELVERIKEKKAIGLEVGLGSGCISISFLKHCKNASVLASDISDEAISCAKVNAHKHGVEERLEIIKANLFDDREENYDFIVSNPPYISKKEYGELMRDVKDYEPKIALTDGGDGLYFYEKIVEIAKKHLKIGGFLAFEIGMSQAHDISKILKAASFDKIIVKKDLSGKDRIVIGEL